MHTTYTHLHKRARALAHARTLTHASRSHTHARPTQVEALRRTVCGVQEELEKAIAAMGLRVKFELLHDELPQVGC